MHYVDYKPFNENTPHNTRSFLHKKAYIFICYTI